MKTRIAFTSCARFEAFPDQPQWGDIERANPDYLFLLGDQIYMDFGYWPFSREYNGKPKQYSPEQFRQIMEGKYERQWNEPNFKHLVETMRTKNGFHGIWDDHDFAWNNALGSEVPQTIKDSSRACFHKWMDCSTNRPEIYYHIDIPGARAIFLDNRYHASPGNLLGDEQFHFLAKTLDHPQKYTFICAGLPLTRGPSSWRRKFPGDYRKLCSLIAEKRNVLFLAGDIHRNAWSPPSVEHNCHEFVASGMAVNYLGLPFRFDDCRNWGLVEYDDDEVIVRLVDKAGWNTYRIDANTGEHGGIP